jgi:hypothetical protein
MLSALPRRIIVRSLAVLALASLGACDLDQPTDPVKTQIVRVDVHAETLRADGTSRSPVTATLAEDTPLGIEVTFFTDMGLLTGGGSAPAKELKVNAGSREVTLTLISSLQAGVATVTARTSGDFDSDTVTFAPAEPSFLELSTDVSTARANGQDVVAATARLFRELGAGTVSQGTRVQFEVKRDGTIDQQLSGTELTDSSGTATRRLITRAPGTYQIVAAAAGKSDTATVVFTAP